MRASMVTLLPEPDSPTTPRISPSSSVRLTPSTARSTPLEVGNSTERFWMSRRGIRHALLSFRDREAGPGTHGLVHRVGSGLSPAASPGMTCAPAIILSPLQLRVERVAQAVAE